MKTIEAPGFFPTVSDNLNSPTLFLAGSITDCPDWQKDLIKDLTERKLPLIVLNPRRANFPIHDPNAALAQITWEFKGLRASSMISFWFSKETLGPIVLYELGAHLQRWSVPPHQFEPRIVIGMDPGYKRRQDVEIQTELIRPRTPIVYDLKAMAREIHRMTAVWAPLATPVPKP